MSVGFVEFSVCVFRLTLCYIIFSFILKLIETVNSFQSTEIILINDCEYNLNEY